MPVLLALLFALLEFEALRCLSPLFLAAGVADLVDDATPVVVDVAFFLVPFSFPLPILFEVVTEVIIPPVVARLAFLLGDVIIISTSDEEGDSFTAEAVELQCAAPPPLILDADDAQAADVVVSLAGRFFLCEVNPKAVKSIHVVLLLPDFLFLFLFLPGVDF